MSDNTPLRDQLLRLGPQMPRPPMATMARAALGAGLGLVMAEFVLSWLMPSGQSALVHPLLIAPFGASAFLAFVFSASPLAQPWPLIMGNILAAIAAMIATKLGLPLGLCGPLAVALSVLAMGLARAQHPPAAALALFAALNPPANDLLFLLTPVLAGSLTLVVSAMVWGRLSGQRYPHILPIHPR